MSVVNWGGEEDETWSDCGVEDWSTIILNAFISPVSCSLIEKYCPSMVGQNIRCFVQPLTGVTGTVFQLENTIQDFLGKKMARSENSQREKTISTRAMVFLCLVGQQFLVDLNCSSSVHSYVTEQNIRNFSS